MTKKITLTVNGSRFDIDLDQEFADYLLEQMQEELNVEGNNELKILLQAYVRKNYAIFLQEKKIADMLEALEQREQ